MTGTTPSTVLPARREDVEFHTSDGLRLVGELALPIDRPPAATLVTLHPLPTEGGFMDSHVLRKASYRLPALADLAVLRFNTRGTCSPRGCSDGEFDSARGEQFDVEAAVAFAQARGLPKLWLLGWSFGTDLALMHGLLPGVEGAVLLSPPLRFTTPGHLNGWARDGRPLTVLVPDRDDFLRPDAARAAFAGVPQAQVRNFDAVHLWVGERQVREALSAIVAATRPKHPPIDWDAVVSAPPTIH